MSRPLDVIRSEIAEAAARLNEALGRLDTAWTELHNQQPGFPGGGTGNGEPATQPERLHATWRNDPAVIDLDNLDRSARRAIAEATVVYDVATRWGTRRKAAIDPDDQPGDEWCRSCWRDIRADRHYCEPVAHGTYARYCRWCGDFYGAYRCDPPLPLVQARHDGQRVTQQMIDRELRRAGRRIAS